jgi:very-short-patch-repair endonuclease
MLCFALHLGAICLRFCRLLLYDFVMNRRNIVTGWCGEAKPQRAQNLRAQMTPQEWLLWQQIRSNRLDGLHFRRQVTIDGFLPDFYCHSLGLVIEVDGIVHEKQQEYDTLRDRVITARGLRILRFTNTEVETAMPKVIAAIQSAAKEQK